MKHEFSLTSKAAAALIAGLSVIAILLIAVGVFIGIGLGVPVGETQTARRSGTAPEKSLPSKPASAAAMASARNGPEATAIPEPPQVIANASAQPPPPVVGLEATITKASVTRPLQKGFALQVGAFLDLKNAQSLAENLKGRGYAVSLLNSLDARQRLWHAVRVGPANEPGYADLQTASRAAADFISKEQIQALIRPADSL